MGESITEGTILEWHKEIGELIEKDETLLEIGTDKVDSEIPSPESGTVCDILAKPNDVIDVGNVIARINTDGDSHQPFQKIEELEKIEESEEPEIKKQVKVHKEVKKGEKETNEINKSIDSNSALYFARTRLFACQPQTPRRSQMHGVVSTIALQFASPGHRPDQAEEILRFL